MVKYNYPNWYMSLFPFPKVGDNMGGIDDRGDCSSKSVCPSTWADDFVSLYTRRYPYVTQTSQSLTWNDPMTLPM